MNKTTKQKSEKWEKHRVILNENSPFSVSFTPFVCLLLWLASNAKCCCAQRNTQAANLHGKNRLEPKRQNPIRLGNRLTAEPEQADDEEEGEKKSPESYVQQW